MRLLAGKIGIALLVAVSSIGSFGNVVYGKQDLHRYVIQLSGPNDADLRTAQSQNLISDINQKFNFSKNKNFVNTYSFLSRASLLELQHQFDQKFISLKLDETFLAGAVEASIVPNDPGFSQNGENIDKQWGLIKSNIPQAWEKTTGARDVIIAVIDTGIDATHEDFDDTAMVNGYNTITNKQINRRVNSDDNGHGTLVAGVIAASTDNGVGIAGAAFDVTIMPLKALDAEGSGGSINIAEAIVWATDNGADVINLSLGGNGLGHNSTLGNAISYAYNKNVVIVAAAGNDVAVNGGNLDEDPVFPICNDNGKNMVIGVTATDVNDRKPQFANYGKACVDVSAPGRRILSTINHDPVSGEASPNSYAYASGTSLAAPFVSAQAGLLRSLFVNASNRQIRDRIISTADSIDDVNLTQCASISCAGFLGAGRINVAASLEKQISLIDDGDIVQVIGTNDVYYINGGKRQRISAFVRGQRFKNQELKQVALSDIENFPEGSYAEPLDGTLVQQPNDATVYYMQDGLRRPLTYQVFNMRGFKFADITTVTNVELNSWIVGSFLTPPEGTLVRTTTNQTVYWTVGETIHPVNYKFYVERGLQNFPVIYTSESDINSYPKGDPFVL